MSEREYKRLMTADDELFGMFLQDLIDRNTTTYEDKLKIFKWFESFDYPGKLSVMDMMLRHAAKLDW